MKISVITAACLLGLLAGTVSCVNSSKVQNNGKLFGSCLEIYETLSMDNKESETKEKLLNMTEKGCRQVTDELSRIMVEGDTIKSKS